MGSEKGMWEAGVPASKSWAAESPQEQQSADDLVDPADIVVHGRGSMLEVLAVLQDIAAAQATALGTKKASSPAMSRQFKSKGEFSALVQRVQREEATAAAKEHLAKMPAWVGQQ